MKKIQSLMFLAFVMVGSFNMLNAKGCEVKMINKTGYNLLLNKGTRTKRNGMSYSKQTIKNGDAFTNITDRSKHGEFTRWTNPLTLLGTSGEAPITVPLPKGIGNTKNCLDPQKTYSVTIDPNTNDIVVQ